MFGTSAPPPRPTRTAALMPHYARCARVDECAARPTHPSGGMSRAPKRKSHWCDGSEARSGAPNAAAGWPSLTGHHSKGGRRAREGAVAGGAINLGVFILSLTLSRPRMDAPLHCAHQAGKNGADAADG